ncbi:MULTISPECIES: SDR family oxidoreductase [Brucella/Ochrobactrum group]|jgi:NAD(P)-dependent dehydrogenase (short-subunit alcohol dehydrogenase family)|uniref:D-threitol dehydrogenase n=1 Tax=Brucella pseudintermedia TaxID=370111 RepID=A0ABY5UMF6_9HYPH|nr:MULTISPECIES: D-threitol dehydrogenase [Brucella/Ochrobactrum group]KAB2683379.1 D-threitol dehydrogenase [Brucella pseudintermedia]MCO7728230.1 D-threitol dehydrogenase [Brucella intermedia]NKE74134.1 D-threitol dehydrogenase [Ochrobactrum sp. MC-1LL]TWH03506.1 NAD(P)-dependent dehydrogenase (short-subunit alcohol dehydrogenase family) [Ochrobactrum sp. J50]UWL62970.1 D-threitol dehydrogenase [Brucella pseudintermedia]
MSEQAPQIDLNFPLSGKVAIVTGGASGIGAAISRAFIAKGAKVAVLDISADIAKAKAGELGENAKPFVCDVSSQQSVNDAIAAVKDQFGAIDIAVNSAGVVYLAPADEISVNDWDKTIAINLKGSFLVTQAVGRAMIAAGRGGKIINLASQAGTVAIEEHVAYCASKFGVIGMSKTFAAEWGKHGICVNTLSPTIVLTELGKKAWAGEKGEAAKKRIPAGRFAYPEEIAAAAVFLASAGADMITGADLLIDGGYTIL